MPEKRPLWTLPAGVLLVCASTNGLAMEADSEKSTEAVKQYNAVPLEGGDSVTDDLAQDAIPVGSWLRSDILQDALSPWFEAKKSLKKNYGLNVQLSYQALYQQVDVEDIDTDDAAAGRAEFQGVWTLFDRNGPNKGSLSFRFEDRHTLDSEIPPTSLFREIGSIVPTATGFSDFGGAWTELAWRQTAMGGRLKLIGGKISAISWYNAHALSGAKKGFVNPSLQSSLSKPLPGRGLGAGGAFMVSPGFVVVAGAHDANAKSAENPFDSIEEEEYYSSVEFRWLPNSIENARWDKVQVQLWHQDAKEKAGVQSGKGMTFLVSKLLDDRWMPYVLGGISDGDASTFEQDFVAGLGVGFNSKAGAARDVLGVAVGWGNPSNELLREQYSSEVFYRFPLIRNFTITPSLQYIVNPALNPDEDDVVVAGIRMRANI
ncbi:MAG TPA: hypothetical protein DIT58_02145 [Porticoccaceae bacterium]|nr:hypothetical protein [Porticoccaceae bacterium]